eukprot:CAMPEP_0170569862 /NCGR_PEP_ID=MMETSP0224-20130122/791_1 /TAXON_ID=285029 /ORGANISM="Togula jolla, Strain CCCM 725" /LENGTH=59 /DNA_ID=CAMNT_0010892077 /DNA_START=113 /DNA_END=292 /DNA_ORIENTATION=-
MHSPATRVPMQRIARITLPRALEGSSMNSSSTSTLAEGLLVKALLVEGKCSTEPDLREY